MGSVVEKDGESLHRQVRNSASIKMESKGNVQSIRITPGNTCGTKAEVNIDPLGKNVRVLTFLS